MALHAILVISKAGRGFLKNIQVNVPWEEKELTEGNKCKAEIIEGLKPEPFISE